MAGSRTADGGTGVAVGLGVGPAALTSGAVASESGRRGAGSGPGSAPSGAEATRPPRSEPPARPKVSRAQPASVRRRVRGSRGVVGRVAGARTAPTMSRPYLNVKGVGRNRDVELREC